MNAWITGFPTEHAVVRLMLLSSAVASMVADHIHTHTRIHPSGLVKVTWTE